MREGTPIFKKENLMYEREEKDGYYTIISKLHPEIRELIINHTARKILELCNGEKTIQEILDIMSRGLLLQSDIFIYNCKVITSPYKFIIGGFINGKGYRSKNEY